LNGDKGRIQVAVVEKAYINAGGDIAAEGATRTKRITVFPLFAEPYDVEIEEGKGGHGGGDTVMLEDIFGSNPPPDPFNRAATHLEGAYSILVGIAGNKSINTGRPVEVKDLVQF